MAELDTAWMNGLAAKNRLHTTSYRLLKYAALGRIRVLAIPGSPVRYNREDVERLAAELG